MSDAFFDDLGLPKPDFYLDIGSGTHAEQTAGVMVAYERICMERRPDMIILVGDVNSTLACALVVAKMCIPLAHLEAGLRSRDRTMPEEINRIITDSLSDILWTPSLDADGNLRAEGIPEKRIACVGNVMIDSFEMLRGRIEKVRGPESIGVKPKGYGVVTLHRPANVDERKNLEILVRQLIATAQSVSLVFPIHPRTLSRLKKGGLYEELADSTELYLMEPLGYIDFMSLVCSCCFVITDSGGIQEETTYLDIPCITVRDTTERPITITQGTNRLVEPGGIKTAVGQILAGDWPSGRRPDLWDGHTAERIVETLRQRMRRVNKPGSTSRVERMNEAGNARERLT